MPRWLSRSRKSIFCKWSGAVPVSLLAALLLVGSLGATDAEEELTPASLEHFEREVRPLLVQRCYSCHSSRSEKIESGLRLDHKMGVLEGGTRGPALVPGDPGASLLLRAVTGTEPGLSMPPGENLSTLEVQSLVRWIREGAPDPREKPDDSPVPEMESVSQYDFEGPRQYWSFQPLSKPEVPQLPTHDRVRDPIDAFVIETLTKNRLTLAPEADLRTLARRAHQILIGLPLAWER
ncbi:MAG: c-type cytochrome domain-containing protein, partial [Planctomycetota bacterium]